MASRATEAAWGAASASSQGAADSAAAVSSQSGTMSSAAGGLFGQLPSWAKSRSDEARGDVASGVSSMEGSVSGARLVLPSIQMPHIPQLHVEGGFSVSSSGISLPRISFYAHGGRATRPTMAVVAEAGEPENMIPDSKLSGFMLQALEAAGYQPNGDGGESGRAVVAWLDRNLPEIIQECQPVMTDRQAARYVRRVLNG